MRLVSVRMDRQIDMPKTTARLGRHDLGAQLHSSEPVIRLSRMTFMINGNNSAGGGTGALAPVPSRLNSLSLSGRTVLRARC
ncbi:hypothetical protein GCM10028792_18480 [Salinisphaera aquimarina]